MGFITDNFLLENDAARHLYRRYAAEQPILDYHCHLSPRDIATNRRFSNLFEIWLEGDHYKWRLMRADGVPERYCTGDAEPQEKFLAWARTVPHAPLPTARADARAVSSRGLQTTAQRAPAEATSRRVRPGYS